MGREWIPVLLNSGCPLVPCLSFHVSHVCAQPLFGAVVLRKWALLGHVFRVTCTCILSMRWLYARVRGVGLTQATNAHGPCPLTGKQSLETICLLLAYKIKYPENFFLLRGNHECASINRIYGFYDECKRRYNIKLWKTFTDCFNCLPIGMCSLCSFSVPVRVCV